MANEKQFIRIVEMNGKEKIPYSFDSFDPRKKEKILKQKRIEKHYIFTNCLSLVSVGIFLIMLILKYNVPEYFIAIIGAIFGYYLSKKPFE